MDLPVDQPTRKRRAQPVATPRLDWPESPAEMAQRQIIVAAIDKFIQLRHSEWGDQSQTGEFNPHVARYDMLQKFRRAVVQGELLSHFTDLPSDRTEQIFTVWQALAQLTVGADYWGHPMTLRDIYLELDDLSWPDFLTHLSQLDHPGFELVPSRVKNWQVGDRQVGALTFHQASRPITLK
jgi:hypothetical protein